MVHPIKVLDREPNNSTCAEILPPTLDPSVSRGEDFVAKSCCGSSKRSTARARQKPFLEAGRLRCGVGVKKTDGFLLPCTSGDAYDKIVACSPSASTGFNFTFQVSPVWKSHGCLIVPQRNLTAKDC